MHKITKTVKEDNSTVMTIIFNKKNALGKIGDLDKVGI
jgi:hypothetical protein